MRKDDEHMKICYAMPPMVTRQVRAEKRSAMDYYAHAMPPEFAMIRALIIYLPRRYFNRRSHRQEPPRTRHYSYHDDVDC